MRNAHCADTTGLVQLMGCRLLLVLVLLVMLISHGYGLGVFVRVRVCKS